MVTEAVGALLLVAAVLVRAGAAAEPLSTEHAADHAADHAWHAEHAEHADHAEQHAEQHEDEGGRLRRVVSFIKSYAIRHGAGMLTTDDDIKCIMQMGQALRNENVNPLAAPVANALRVVTHTSPHCKLNVLAKGRMFLSPEFIKGLGAALFGQAAAADGAGGGS